MRNTSSLSLSPYSHTISLKRENTQLAIPSSTAMAAVGTRSITNIFKQQQLFTRKTYGIALETTLCNTTGLSIINIRSRQGSKRWDELQ